MNFNKLFYPKSIAIIGASRKEKTVGNDVVRNLATQGFEGEIYPVNPKADELYGKKVYSSVTDVKGDVDMAIIAVPAPYVCQVIEEAHKKKGTSAFIVISAGCKEVGNEQLELEIADYCKDQGIALVGPNCLGVVNPEHSMNASFAALMPDPGSIAFISQSGALCTTVLDYAKQMKLGFSKFVSIGNKAVIDELTLLRYLKDDPKTKVIAMYVEQLRDAPAFIDTVREITTGENAKPVIILKSGKTDEGSAAVASHTGSLSGGSAAYDALFAQAGVIQAQTVSELFDYAAIFSENDLKAIDNAAIITNAGGPGVLTTDAVITAGLKLAKLEESTKKKLREFLPKAASVKNPVDVLGDAVAERYEKTLEIVEADKNVDSIIVILTPQSMTEIVATAQAVVKLKAKSNKPIIASFMGQATVKSGVDLMEKGGVTTSLFPEPAAKTLATLGKFVKESKKAESKKAKNTVVDKLVVKKIFNAAKKKGQTAFPEAEALPILKAYNLPILESAQAANAKEALVIAKKINTNMAMKIVSKDILHKSDVGGVMLNVTAADVEEKFEQMMKTVKSHKPKAKIDGVLLMEMAPQGGMEMILGSNKAAGLGNMVLVGMGGIYVEILKDAQLGFAPLRESDIERMISSLKTYAVLKGARGQKNYDIPALKQAIIQLNQLVLDFPEIAELDINPLLVLPEGQGVKVLDARVVIE